MPILSVVIPSFNVEKFIGETMKGIVEQTLTDWELFVVDDGSNDNTKNIICQFEREDQRIHLVKRNREPKGAQTCRNTGIELASGKYIIIFDSDDVIAPYCFEQRVSYMEEHNVDYATFRGQGFKTDKNGVKKYTHRWGEPNNKDILKGFLAADYPFGIWNNIYRANVCKELMFDEKLAIYQDFDFAVRTVLGGYTHAYAQNSKPDYFYRQGHGGAITSVFITEEKYNSTMYLFEKTLKSIETMDRHDVYKKSFFHFFLLQYERILFNGNAEQKERFFRFIGETYHQYARHRLKLLKLWGEKIHNKRSIILLEWVLFEPKALFKWLKEKID